MYDFQSGLCKATGTTTRMMFTIAVQYFGMGGVLQTWIGRISKKKAVHRWQGVMSYYTGLRRAGRLRLNDPSFVLLVTARIINTI